MRRQKSFLNPVSKKFVALYKKMQGGDNFTAHKRYLQKCPNNFFFFVLSSHDHLFEIKN
jgi:hypothetical protein